MVLATSSAVNDIPMHVANIITSSCLGVISPICVCMIRRIALVEDELLMSLANSVFSSYSNIVLLLRLNTRSPSSVSALVTLVPSMVSDTMVASISCTSRPSSGRCDAACVSSPRKNGCPSAIRIISRMADSSRYPSACHLTSMRDSSLLRL